MVSRWINTGDFLSANLYVTNVTTPVLNTWMGTTANQNMSMFTGVTKVNDTVVNWIDAVGTTLGTDNSWGALTIPVNTWSGEYMMWISLQWYDEKEYSPPMFYDYVNNRVYNVKLPSQTFPSQNVQQKFTTFNTDAYFKQDMGISATV